MNPKKKVGIITLYHGNYNFGGLLQAYALPKVIQECFGVAVEQIDYIPAHRKKTEQKKPDSGILQHLYRMVYRLGIVLFAYINRNNLELRKESFDDFINEIPHSNAAYNCGTIHTSREQYDIFLCGGDQIWNDSEEEQNISVYTLQFAPAYAKKIAYAPSMAVLEYSPDYERIMSDGLSGLDAISVREKRSKAVLSRFTDKQINVVVDPVLLMSADEWYCFSGASSQPDRYILCYLLGDSVGNRREAEKLSRKLHLPILTFPHILLNVVRKCDLFFGDIRDYTSGPREFVGLIKNAEFVITDSFHACVFSMIFKTPFAVFERQKPGEAGNMNSRIYDFLEEYHLEDRLVTEESLAKMEAIPQVDFTYAHAHWKQRREESLQYLRNALKDNEDGEQQ